jgi:hypothetical protein
MNATEKHAELIDAGWRCRLDGRWISPDPNDARTGRHQGRLIGVG